MLGGRGRLRAIHLEFMSQKRRSQIAGAENFRPWSENLPVPLRRSFNMLGTLAPRTLVPTVSVGTHVWTLRVLAAVHKPCHVRVIYPQLTDN